MESITIFFDFEGKYGMPYKSKYDLVKTTHQLLGVLNAYNVKAVFFAVGKIIGEYPDLIKEIAGYGHEIAIHGYVHEHIDKLSKEEMATFSNNLLKIENYLEELIGRRPVAFRSPYLMAPKFYTPEIYKILEEHGYQWVSNRELRYPEELFRPDRLRFPFFWGNNNWWTKILYILLNLGMGMKEKMDSQTGFKRIIANLRWLNDGARPFKRGNLTEIPLYSPLDCDLLGLPMPETATSGEWIRYATACLVGGLNRRGNLYTLNFHDWIIGTSNRLQLLEDVLSFFASHGCTKFVTGSELIRIIKNYE